MAASKQKVSIRYSEDNPCRGVNKDIDPSIISRTELTVGINARVKSGVVVCRGGQSKRNSDEAMDGAVFGLIDTEGEFDDVTAVTGSIFGVLYNLYTPASPPVDPAEWLLDPPGDPTILEWAMWIGTDPPPYINDFYPLPWVPEGTPAGAVASYPITDQGNLCPYQFSGLALGDYRPLARKVYSFAGLVITEYVNLFNPISVIDATPVEQDLYFMSG